MYTSINVKYRGKTFNIPFNTIMFINYEVKPKAIVIRDVRGFTLHIWGVQEEIFYNVLTAYNDWAECNML